MGGINHQPCRNYLAQSTVLSALVCASRLRLEDANIHLEKALLSELEQHRGNPGEFTSALTALDGSIKGADDTITALGKLEQDMRDTNYQPWPAFARFNTADKLMGLGKDLAVKGLIDLVAFEAIALPQLDGGFYATIALLRIELQQVRQRMVELRSAMGDSVMLAEQGMLADELETNGELSFRGKFMMVYQAWNRLYSMFLASAVLSTELWFLSSGAGSLLDDKKDLRLLRAA